MSDKSINVRLYYEGNWIVTKVLSESCPESFTVPWLTNNKQEVALKFIYRFAVLKGGNNDPENILFAVFTPKRADE